MLFFWLQIINYDLYNKKCQKYHLKVLKFMMLGYIGGSKRLLAMNIDVCILSGKHGFSDPFFKNYYSKSLLQTKMEEDSIIDKNDHVVLFLHKYGGKARKNRN